MIKWAYCTVTHVQGLSQDPGYFKLFKGLLLELFFSRIFETNHKLERNQTYMPYSIKCEIIKDSLRN